MEINKIISKNLVKKRKAFQLGPINLEFEPGIITGLLGPNGAGKTTLIHCFLGLIIPDQGEIDPDPKIVGWKDNLGYITEKQIYYQHLSVRQTVKFIGSFYPAFDWQYTTSLFSRLCLSQNKLIKHLSLGEKQKLAWICTLCHKPRILFLDEPFTNLDPVVRREICDILFEEMESDEKMILISSHSIAEIIFFADKLAFIDNGLIHRLETKEDLLTKWKKISYLAPSPVENLPGGGYQESDGNFHLIHTNNTEKCLQYLNNTGVHIQEITNLGLEDIVVDIMKGKKNV